MTALRLLKILYTKLYLMHRPKPYCVQQVSIAHYVLYKIEKLSKWDQRLEKIKNEKKSD